MFGTSQLDYAQQRVAVQSFQFARRRLNGSISKTTFVKWALKKFGRLGTSARPQSAKPAPVPEDGLAGSEVSKGLGAPNVAVDIAVGQAKNYDLTDLLRRLNVDVTNVQQVVPRSEWLRDHSSPNNTRRLDSGGGGREVSGRLRPSSAPASSSNRGSASVSEARWSPENGNDEGSGKLERFLLAKRRKELSSTSSEARSSGAEEEHPRRQPQRARPGSAHGDKVKVYVAKRPTTPLMKATTTAAPVSSISASGSDTIPNSTEKELRLKKEIDKRAGQASALVKSTIADVNAQATQDLAVKMEEWAMAEAEAAGAGVDSKAVTPVEEPVASSSGEANLSNKEDPEVGQAAGFAKNDYAEESGKDEVAPEVPGVAKAEADATAVPPTDAAAVPPLAAAAPGPHGFVPSDVLFAKDDKVEARYRGREEWLSATVLSVSRDGETLDVSYTTDDGIGLLGANLPRDHVRIESQVPAATPPDSATPSATAVFEPDGSSKGDLAKSRWKKIALSIKVVSSFCGKFVSLESPLGTFACHFKEPLAVSSAAAVTDILQPVERRSMQSLLDDGCEGWEMRVKPDEGASSAPAEESVPSDGLVDVAYESDPDFIGVPSTGETLTVSEILSVVVDSPQVIEAAQAAVPDDSAPSTEDVTQEVPAMDSKGRDTLLPPVDAKMSLLEKEMAELEFREATMPKEHQEYVRSAAFLDEVSWRMSTLAAAHVGPGEVDQATGTPPIDAVVLEACLPVVLGLFGADEDGAASTQRSIIFLATFDRDKSGTLDAYEFSLFLRFFYVLAFGEDATTSKASRTPSRRESLAKEELFSELPEDKPDPIDLPGAAGTVLAAPLIPKPAPDDAPSIAVATADFSHGEESKAAALGTAHHREARAVPQVSASDPAWASASDLATALEAESAAKRSAEMALELTRSELKVREAEIKAMRAEVEALRRESQKKSGN